jgi:hypothetical protein
VPGAPPHGYRVDTVSTTITLRFTAAYRLELEAFRREDGEYLRLGSIASDDGDVPRCLLAALWQACEDDRTQAADDRFEFNWGTALDSLSEDVLRVLGGAQPGPTDIGTAEEAFQAAMDSTLEGPDGFTEIGT